MCAKFGSIGWRRGRRIRSYISCMFGAFSLRMPHADLTAHVESNRGFPGTTPDAVLMHACLVQNGWQHRLTAQKAYQEPQLMHVWCMLLVRHACTTQRPRLKAKEAHQDPRFVRVWCMLLACHVHKAWQHILTANKTLKGPRLCRRSFCHACTCWPPQHSAWCMPADDFAGKVQQHSQTKCKIGVPGATSLQKVLLSLMHLLTSAAFSLISSAPSTSCLKSSFWHSIVSLPCWRSCIRYNIISLRTTTSRFVIRNLVTPREEGISSVSWIWSLSDMHNCWDPEDRTQQARHTKHAWIRPFLALQDRNGKHQGLADTLSQSCYIQTAKYRKGDVTSMTGSDCSVIHIILKTETGRHIYALLRPFSDTAGKLHKWHNTNKKHTKHAWIWPFSGLVPLQRSSASLLQYSCR